MLFAEAFKANLLFCVRQIDVTLGFTQEFCLDFFDAREVGHQRFRQSLFQLIPKLNNADSRGIPMFSGS